MEKAREFQKNIYVCVIDYAKDFNSVGHNKIWKIQEMGISDHPTCLLRNLYAGQEATVRTGHGTTDWFQIGKRVHQGCILSLCLFNLYAEYIMRNAGLKEAQAGIKIAAATAKSLQSCLTLCDPMDCSQPGSSVHGILQARILEWVAISFSRGSSQPRGWTQVSCIADRRFILWATKQGDNIQPWCTPFPIWNQSVVPRPVLTVASWPAYRFLKRQVRWPGISISFRISHSLLWSTQSKVLAESINQK